jgi:hypothetical protein
MNRAQVNEQHTWYKPERLPPAAERTLGEGNLRAATHVARGVHCSNQTLGEREPKTGAERAKLNRLLRIREEMELRDWAGRQGLMVDADGFANQWQEAGQIEGAEHQIYPDDNGFWHKRNDLIFHGTWLEYFHRLALHNWLFPDAAYRFDGFMDVAGVLYAVTAQKSVLAECGATRAHVEREMRKMGFERTGGDDYYSRDLGVIVEDLHDENAVFTPKGSLVIFDPIIYLPKPEMGLAHQR